VVINGELEANRSCGVDVDQTLLGLLDAIEQDTAWVVRLRISQYNTRVANNYHRGVLESRDISQQIGDES
jgi:hypothetical protein